MRVRSEKCMHRRSTAEVVPPYTALYLPPQGSVAVGDTVELPALKLQRPVRSMQAFRRPVARAVQVRAPILVPWKFVQTSASSLP